MFDDIIKNLYFPQPKHNLVYNKCYIIFLGINQSFSRADGKNYYLHQSKSIE